MKRTTGAIHQDKGIDRALDFVLENELVQETGTKPIVTSKGEQLLNEIAGSSGGSDLVGGR